jgi:hypothetical protein
MSTQPVEMFIDDVSLSSSLFTSIADIEFQATTRGGRRMDAILRGQAAYRDTTVGVGSALSEIGNNVGGLGGLGLALIGVAVQGAGGAMSPEADTRAWETLPREYEVYALNLPSGEHKAIFEQNVYFELRSRISHSFVISDPKDVAVVFAPPSLHGLYSSHCEEEIKLSSRDKNSGAGSIIVTPPLGLERIERFSAHSEKDDVEACAPDVKRMMRKIKRALKNKNIPSYLVNHQEILNTRSQYTSPAQLALQVELNGLEVDNGKKQKIYTATYDMRLINTSTGKAEYSSILTGTFSGEETSATKGFYGSLSNAVEKFISEKEFAHALKRVNSGMMSLQTKN